MPREYMLIELALRRQNESQPAFPPQSLGCLRRDKRLQEAA